MIKMLDFFRFLICLAALSCHGPHGSSSSVETASPLASCQFAKINSAKIPGISKPYPVRLPQRPAGAISPYRPHHLPLASASTLFGVEIEFPIVKNGQEALSRFKDLLKAPCDLCPGACEAVGDTLKGPMTFTIREGNLNPSSIKIRVSEDIGVIEVSTTPLTYDQTISWQPVLDQLIFDTAHKLEKEGLVSSVERERNRWSGHINISWPGLMEARNTPDILSENLIINLFIDLQNFPELAMGVLGGDVRNAPPLALGSKTEQDKLRAIIKDYREGSLSNLTLLAKRLIKDTVPTSFRGGFARCAPGQLKYTLINLEPLIHEKALWGYAQGTRIELRGFFSPLSVESMLTNYRIINARLAYLQQRFNRKDRQALDFSPPRVDIRSLYDVGSPYKHRTEGLIGNLSPGAAAAAYVRYLSESGLNPCDELQFLRDPIVKRAVENHLDCRSQPGT